ncbi:multicopper oxidase domain-containing protein [Pelobium sp.]|nr:multicopper oxidase domain-containing protein [Pelobium sp.]MDA9554625.1 multicopper oxidase domain-containing protein [Pelobium sp.]
MKKLITLLFITVISQSIFAQQNIKSYTATPNDHLVRPGKRVVYDLYITDTLVNFTGKAVKAQAINGQIPGPTLRFTEGDTAIIHVHNKMKDETSMHWHGILLPNKFDGVPYLETAPIMPGQTHDFIFPLRQTGTYWYHSHTKLQEQAGLFGSIVIEAQNKSNKIDQYPDKVLVLSDWTNQNPKNVLRMLKRGSDYFAIKKGAVQSYGEAISKGYGSDKLMMEWMRMPAMDISDIKYDKFFINGKENVEQQEYKAGETVRLRIIDGSASSYFWVQFAGGQMTVIAADGLEVQPIKVDKLLLGVAETYDVLITIPKDGKYEFRATPHDVSGQVSTFFGAGALHKAPDIPKLNYFRIMHSMSQMMMGMKGMQMSAVKNDKLKKAGMLEETSNGMEGKMGMSDDMKTDIGNMQIDGMKGMDMKSADTKMKGMKMDGMKGMDMKSDSSKMKMDGMKGMDMGGMDMMGMKDDGRGVKMTVPVSMMNSLGGEGKILTYDMLKAKASTEIDSKQPLRTFQLYLTGSMLRYVWSINNKTLSEQDVLSIKKGEKVRFVMHNTTMMEHPMHLHGHFFRVINAQGKYSPLKHTVSVEPMKTVTIEFDANEEKDWFFHCHILYHMNAGMARVLRYENSPVDPAITQYRDHNPLLLESNHPFFWASTAIQSQANYGVLNISNVRYSFNADWRFSYDGRYEVTPRLERYLDNRFYFSGYIGAEFKNDTKGGAFLRDDKQNAFLGLRYLLPLFIQTDVRISQNGKARFEIGRSDIPVSNRIRLGGSWNTDKEYRINTTYILGKNLGISGNYDSDYGWGAGLRIMY